MIDWYWYKVCVSGCVLCVAVTWLLLLTSMWWCWCVFCAGLELYGFLPARSRWSALLVLSGCWWSERERLVGCTRCSEWFVYLLFCFLVTGQVAQQVFRVLRAWWKKNGICNVISVVAAVVSIIVLIDAKEGDDVGTAGLTRFTNKMKKVPQCNWGFIIGNSFSCMYKCMSHSEPCNGRGGI